MNRVSVSVTGLFAALIVATVACDGDRERGSAATHESRSTDSKARPDHCPDAVGRAIWGRVLVPETTAAGERDAGVGARRRERPVRDVAVRIYRRGASEKVLGSAETDANGRWCLRIPGKIAFGVSLVAEASWRDTEMRSSLVAPRNQKISFRSEALARALESDGAEISAARYLNLRAVASTVLDLRSPVYRRPDEGPETFLSRATSVLKNSPRFRSVANLGSGTADVD